MDTLSIFSSHSVDEWLLHIENLHPRLIDLGLDRISRLAEVAGLSRFACPVVTVAGTNGKGSCMHCLESIYTAAGYRVGAYTSPHLLHFNERIRIQGQPVNDASLIQAFTTVEELRQEQSLSFFEFTTLAALWLFQQASLDVVLLEVGLGGRLDAVNVVDADVAVITGIDLDHTALLGETREAIGYEKAGIFRPQQRVICGDPLPPASVRQQADRLGVAQFYQSGQDFTYAATSQETWRLTTPQQVLDQLPVTGIKPQNAATSLMVVEALQSRLPVMRTALDQGLAQLSIPGRFEQVMGPVHCILDVAHNPQAARWLAAQLQALRLDAPLVAVVAMLADKDLAGSTSALIPLIDTWCVAGLSVPRGGDGAALCSILAAQGAKDCRRFATVAEAFNAAVQIAAQHLPSQSPVVVFGSFYTVAAVKELL